MSDTWLCAAGIRVTDLDHSLAFYKWLLDLEELKHVSHEESAYVLLRDRRSGQRIELNWYAPTSPFYAPFVVGEGLDHLEVRVRDVPAMLERLRQKGLQTVNRSLWTNPKAVRRLKSDPVESASLEEDVWMTTDGHRIAYIHDPDGNLICLYDHPEENWDDPVPDHY